MKQFALTKDQQAAMDSLRSFLDDAKAGEVFRMYGYAGTGKTSCSVAIKDLKLSNGKYASPLYVAFTNKAVAVLKSKGCIPAATVHSVLYGVNEHEVEETTEDAATRQAYLDAVLAGVPPSERPPMPGANTEISFGLRDEMELIDKVRGHNCVAIDESSMIGERQGEDLFLLNLPIVAIGDPGQLPPVGDEPAFDPRYPDVLLTEILRQGDGNDILELAQHVRIGGSFLDIDDGQNFQIRRKAPPEWFDCDQVVCGIHSKRQALNNHIRELKGFSGFLPRVGEKLMAVANNKDQQIFNGTLWTVTRSEQQGDYANMDLIEFSPCTEPEILEVRLGVNVHTSCFVKDVKSSTDMGVKIKYGSSLMTWGYAITCHKSQGSQFNTGLVFDDGAVFKGHARNWRYTAVTRFAKHVNIVSRH